MGKSNNEFAALVKDAEKSAVKKLRERQSTQSFDGTLRIDLQRVFVDSKDGKRALEYLRRMNTGQFVKSK